MTFSRINTFKVCLTFGALILFMASWANAKSDMRHYLVEKGETLSGIAFYELGDAELWKEIQKNNNVPNPKKLMPGTDLQIPVDLYMTNPVTALVIRVKGEAMQLSSLGEEVRLLTTGDELSAGSIIETNTASSVVLQFVDQSRFFISERSRIALEVLQGKIKSKDAKTVIKVEAGKTESRVSTQQKGAKYEVVTPEMRLAVRGTEFLVNVDPVTKTSRAMVMEGVVSASNKESTANDNVYLKQGVGFISNEAAEGIAVDLLPKPQLSVNTQPNTLSSWAASWASVSDEKEYRVQLFTSEGYDLTVSDTIQENQDVTFNNLADGFYEFKVRAIDSAKMEGLTASIKFEIDAFPTPPVLKGNNINTKSSKKIKFSWQPEQQAEYYHFEIYSAEGSTSYFSKIDKIPADVNHVSFRLAPGEYLWRVASINEKDGHGPFSQTNKVNVNEH